MRLAQGSSQEPRLLVRTMASLKDKREAPPAIWHKTGYYYLYSCVISYNPLQKENEAKLGSSTSNEAFPKLFSKTPWKVETSHCLFKGQPRKEVLANSKVLSTALHCLYC